VVHRLLRKSAVAGVDDVVACGRDLEGGMKEGELLDKLETKYERPNPGPCEVCGGDLSIAHKGGGLPLRWVCKVALAATQSQPDDEMAKAHLSESTQLDYRKVGDARVMQLIRMYRSLRARLPDEVLPADLEASVE